MTDKKNMLIIEDDQAFALVLANYYTDKFNIHVAHTAGYAKEILTKFTPDEVLLDYFLPDQLGSELVSVIKEGNPRARIIVISANESSKTVVELIGLGIRNYVVKDENSINEVNKILNEPADE